MQFLILGAPHSGTELVARILQDWVGSEGGAELAADARQRDLTELNDELLGLAGFRWFDVDPGRIRGAWADLPGSWIERLRSWIPREPQTSQVLEDPRFSVTLPAWAPVLSGAHAVLCHRHPGEVAGALRGSSFLAPPLSRELWKTYSHSALHVTRDLPRSTVSIRRLVEAPLEALQELAESLASSGLIVSEERVETSAQGLREAGTGLESVPAVELELSTELQRMMRELDAGELPEVAPPRVHSDEVRAGWQVYEEVAQQLEHAAALETRVRELEADREAQHATIQRVRARNQELQDEARRAHQYQQELEKSQGALREFADRQELQRSELEQVVEDRSQLLVWLNETEQVYRRMKKSVSWKLAHVGQKVIPAKQKETGFPGNRLRDTIKSFRKWRETWDPDAVKVIMGSPASTAPAHVVATRPVDIVVCVHNSPEDVRRCLDSLERHTNLRNHHLILVDDGSEDETRRLVVEAVTRLGGSYIRNEEPRGYTRAANQGLKRSRAALVILLNSDTVVTPGWVEALERCAQIPGTACVGPLSNAASWQSVPELQDPDGRWKVNVVPPGFTLDEYARSIAANSCRLYPEVPFVNGFCFGITRQALNEVGFLDEENFPLGYGEEDDFALRAIEAGFRNRIADDAFVFHAKSKSFTPERRKKLVAEARPVITTKHPKFTALARSMEDQEELLRSRVTARLTGARRPEPVSGGLPAETWTIAWLQPHLRTVGGIRRAIEMTNRMVGWGHRAILVTPEGTPADWLPMAAEVCSVEEAKQRELDVLIVSDPDMVEPFLAMTARTKVNYHLAAYAQYRDSGALLDRYYGLGDEVIQLANSQWTAEQIPGTPAVDGVLAGGVDPRLFRPVRGSVAYDVACYGSPRPHKGTEAIVKAAEGWRLLRFHSVGADQDQLANLIGSARVFASACWHEGFNLCPLEAMACGVPVAMTDDGGSREYARHEENALVVRPKDVSALRDAIERLLNDRPLRRRLIENGMATAWSYRWDTVTRQLLEILASRVNPTG